MKTSVKSVSLSIAAVLLILGFVFVNERAKAQGLSVTYGANGLQQLRYNGTLLEDVGQYPADAFHIWHMKLTDLQGNVHPGGQYGWGEDNAGKTWDAGNHRWTYSFPWGSLQVQYVVSGNNLDMIVTEANNSGSGVILDGAVIYPLALHFPGLPAGFGDASYPQLTFTTTMPGVRAADYGTGEAVMVTPDASKPLYSGFWPTGNGTSYTAMISGTEPDGLAVFNPHFERPIQPGQTDTFTVSLRFAASGTATTSIASDAYANYANTFPAQLNWTDRRPIGTVYLASSPTSGDVNQPGGFPNNPRRYFNDGQAGDFDINTAAGLAAFQQRILQRAQDNVANMNALGAQGSVTWDIEGEQYPQATSYVCSPDQIAQVAPEMESIITDSSSEYKGMKLDDAYFKIMTDAGYKVGVCVRPQHFTLRGNGTAAQVVLPANADVVAELKGKIAYAHQRWGARLFYVDSSVDTYGGPLDPAIFQALNAAFPDSLLMPEESTPKDYAYTAPFQTFLFHGDTGTDPTVRAYYPNAFSAVLINDADPATLAAATPKLTASVKAGDLLMGHVGYAQANNPTIVAIYKAAGTWNPVGGTPTPTPTPTPDPPPPPTPTPTPDPPPPPPPTPTPTPDPPPAPVVSPVQIVAPASGTTVSGVINVAAVVGVNLDAAGSFLMVDGVEFGTQRLMSAPFNYTLNTAALSNGAHTLQLWAHDTNNTVQLSTGVAVTVSNSQAPITNPPDPTPTPVPPPVTTAAGPVAITFPVAGEAVSGTVQVAASITQTLDAAGSFLIVDGAEVGTMHVTTAPYLYALDTTSLSPGTHTLQLWAHNTNNEVMLSTPVAITVSR